MIRRTLTAALAAAVLTTTAPAYAGPAEPTSPASRTHASALAGWHLYADRASSAATAAAGQAQGTERKVLKRLGRTPTGVWLTDDGGPARAQAVLAAASAAHRQPVLVAYDMVGRDCGGYSAGGASSPEAYQAWVRALVQALRSEKSARRAVVVLEPDSIAQALTCATSTAGQRYALLKYAVKRLGRVAGVRVYVDAGHAGWPADPVAVAAALKASGVRAADGFALNTSGFQTTGASEAWGERISAALGGGVHFVIDTSRNGNGPSPDANWCNPSGRALGHRPTTHTGDRLVDAFLWVKVPGESDGTCSGGPPAGTFWPAYALALAAGAGWG